MCIISLILYRTLTFKNSTFVHIYIAFNIQKKIQHKVPTGINATEKYFIYIPTAIVIAK